MVTNQAYTAYQSFEALASSFMQTVFPWRKKLFIRDPVCWSKDGQTSFFLDATRTDEYSDTCTGTDWIILVILFIILHTISWSTRWVLWEPFFTWHKSIQTSKSHGTKAMVNFSRALTACLFHAGSAYFGFAILFQKDWLHDTTRWFQTTKSIDPDFKFYYLLYAAWYMSDSVSFFFESKRSDSFAYAIHHVATVLLVLLSAHSGYTVAGGVIMFFFDWADPFILLAKACKYLSDDSSDIYQFMADRLFEMFAVVFFLTRNGMYSYVVYAALTDELQENTVTRTALNTLLVVLALLMKYWLFLIGQAVIHRSGNMGKVEDIREDAPQNGKQKTK